MENMREERNERRDDRVRAQPVLYTRTLMLYPVGDDSYVAAYCRAFGVQYMVLKIGRNVQVGGSDVLIHGAMVLGVPKCGSYKLVDRDRIVFAVITESGVEATTDRWPGLEFEHIESQVSFGYVTLAGSRQLIEVKCGVGKGSVPPYARQAVHMADVGLPGFEPLEEEGSFRELRDTLRREREERDSTVSTAVRRREIDAGAARMHGIRVDELARAAGAVRNQAKREEVVDAVKPGVSVGGQRQAFEKKATDWAQEVEEAEKPQPRVRRQAKKMCNTQEYIDLMRDVEDGGELGKDEFLDIPQNEIEIDGVVKEVTFDAVDNVPIFDLDEKKMNAKMVRLGTSNRGVVTRTGGGIHLLPQALER